MPSAHPGDVGLSKATKTLSTRRATLSGSGPCWAPAVRAPPRAKSDNPSTQILISQSSFLIDCSSNHFPRRFPGGLLTVVYDPSVHPHRPDSEGSRSRLVRRCEVPHRQRIEEHQVSELARRDPTAVDDSDVARGQTRHLPNGLFQREQPPLANVFAEDARERAKAARVPAVECTIAAHVGERPPEQLLDVALVHARSDHAFRRATRPLLHRDRLTNEGHERRRRVRPSCRGDLRHRLANVRRVGIEPGEQETIRRRHLAQHELGGLAIVEVTLGKQNRQRRLPVGIGIDVGGDVDARRARPLERAQEAVRLPPQAPHRELDVRYLNREVRLTTDRDDLLDRCPEVAILASHVADVSTPERGGDLCQLDDLAGRRVDSGIVFEPGREPERAGRHLGPQKVLHATYLVGSRGATVVRAHHLLADRAVPRVRCDVDGRRHRLESREVLGQRRPRSTVLSYDDRRYALTDGAGGLGHFGESTIVMAMRVDEAGRQDQPTRIDDTLSSSRLENTDLGDTLTDNAYARTPSWRARPVDE